MIPTLPDNVIDLWPRTRDEAYRALLWRSLRRMYEDSPEAFRAYVRRYATR